MKSLHTLIRLHKQNLENLLKALNKFEILQEQRKSKIEILHKDIYNARKDKIPEFAQIIDNYIETSAKSIKGIQSDITKTTHNIVFVESKIKEEYSDYKKYQIIQAKIDKTLQEKINKDEMKNIDSYNMTKLKT